ncbi:MAG: response regulator transcription factor [Deltaproteobacteria bacterium]|nr:response regulator transcription factor [Deltaproteobacteria bacterium]
MRDYSFNPKAALEQGLHTLKRKNLPVRDIYLFKRDYQLLHAARDGNEPDKKKILIIEDDKDLLMGLKDNLCYEGYEVITGGTGTDGLKTAGTKKPDLIILDIMLPDMDGLEVCRRLREQRLEIPIIMLTAKSQEIDKVLGLEMGADDYITKPFGIKELLARIRAVLRRGKSIKLEVYRFGNVEIDFSHFRATKNGKELELTSLEFEIIKLLIENKGLTVSRDKMLEKVWGYNLFPTTRTVDNHILKLRKKVEDNPHNPFHILTIHGYGYKFID